MAYRGGRWVAETCAPPLPKPLLPAGGAEVPRAPLTARKRRQDCGFRREGLGRSGFAGEPRVRTSPQRGTSGPGQVARHQGVATSGALQ